jgi:hypothetical protein
MVCFAVGVGGESVGVAAWGADGGEYGGEAGVMSCRRPLEAGGSGTRTGLSSSTRGGGGDEGAEAAVATVRNGNCCSSNTTCREV